MTKGAQAYNRVNIGSLINGIGRTILVHAKKKKMKPDHQLIPHTRINSKWRKDLNVSHDIIKVLEENIGSKISDIPCSNIFADISSRAREIKNGIIKWDLIKIKRFCMAKENISKMKRDPTIWERYIFQ